MGRLMGQYDKAYMKTAMLNQEETFRQQVNELHRLYRVQKLLMRGAAGPHAPCGDCGEEEGDDVELTLATGGGRGSRRSKADSSGSAGPGASLTSSASTEPGSGSAGESLDVRDWGLWCRGPDEGGQRALAVAVRQGSDDHRHRHGPTWHLHHWSLNVT